MTLKNVVDTEEHYKCVDIKTKEPTHWTISTRIHLKETQEELSMLDGQQPAEHHGLTDEDAEGMPQGNEPVWTSKPAYDASWEIEYEGNTVGYVDRGEASTPETAILYWQKMEDVFPSKETANPFNGIKASDLQVGGKHYKSMAIQPSEFIYRNELNWLEGNAIKYICRHARKHGRADIDKAIHYLELLKEWHYDEA